MGDFGTATREISAEGLTDEDLEYLRHWVNRSAVYNLVTTAKRTTPVIRTARALCRDWPVSVDLLCVDHDLFAIVFRCANTW